MGLNIYVSREGSIGRTAACQWCSKKPAYDVDAGVRRASQRHWRHDQPERRIGAFAMTQYPHGILWNQCSDN